jgi:hypothetical protein
MRRSSLSLKLTAFVRVKRPALAISHQDFSNLLDKFMMNRFFIR